MEQLAKWLKNNNIAEVECITPVQSGIVRGEFMPREEFIAEYEGFKRVISSCYRPYSAGQTSSRTDVA